MSRLSEREFNAMNTAVRRMFQRWVEFPLMQRLGTPVIGQDVLEIGCGSGYGAELIGSLKPHAYVGLDFMPEQVGLARKRLPGTRFLVQDAADMKAIPSGSQDTVVVFGVLHHIPEWRAVLAEMARVLRPGGQVYLEEPESNCIHLFDRFVHWGHPTAFSLRELESQIRTSGFGLLRRIHLFGFGIYRLQRV